MSLLVAPGLLAQASACRTRPALARLARYAGAPIVDPEGLATLTCAVLGGLGARPVAALTALGAGLDAAGAYWLVADPVTLVAGQSDVALAGRVGDLSIEEAEELLTALNAHFHDDDLVFVAPRPDLWLARMREAPAIVTTSLDRASTVPLAEALPAGEAGAQWRRWLDEMQMLLHTHPVNDMREGSDAAPANAVWLWGGGRLADAGPLPLLEVEAAATRLGDLLRGIAGAAEASGHAHAPPRRARLHETIDSEARLDHFIGDALEPALSALERGELAQLDVLADGNGIAAAWRAQKPSAWQRMAGRWRASPFEVPAPSAAD